MKIKQVFAQLLTALVVLLAAKAVVGGFVFSSAISYVGMFLALYLSSEWFATKIRIFFLLPSLLLIPILIHSAIIAGVFYLANSIFGGITIVPTNPQFITAIPDFLPIQQLGEFGTIVMVSLWCGTVYQLINWLYLDK